MLLKNIFLTMIFFIANISLAIAGVESYLEFQYISTDKGLSQKTVQSIFQDSHGAIWVGTQEGLNKYDGQNITIFNSIVGNNKSLSNNFIRDVSEDSQQNLWVATNGGLNKFDSKSNSFFRIEITNENNEDVLRLNTIFNDADGRILVGTDGYGVYSIDTNKNTIQASPLSSVAELKNADVRVIFMDSRNRYWFGTDGEGLWQINERGKVIGHFLFNEKLKNSISHNRIRSIMEDSKGQIWIGTRGGGLNKYNELNKSFARYQNDPTNPSSISNNRVYRIIEDKNRTLWIATDGGINLLRSDSNEFLKVKSHQSQASGLSHNRVLTLMEDSGGLIWLGTLSGLNIWNPVTAKFVHYRNISETENSLNNNTIFGVEESQSGKIYVATFGGGLNYFDPIENEWSVIESDEKSNSLFSDMRLMSLMVDRKHNLWVGSFSKGVSVLSDNHQLKYHFENDKTDPTSLSANGITDILQDSDEEVWVATYSGGLNRLNKDGKSFRHYRMKGEENHGLNSDSIIQILEDDEGYLWLATDGGGISKLDKNTGMFTNFIHQPENKNSLTGNAAVSIYQDSRGRFWIGTQGRGLNRWEPEDRRQGKNKFIHYTVENGLPSSTVNGVLEDSSGYIWISTNKGVSRLNPESNELRHYNLARGIHNNELNQGAMLKTLDGRLYFGGINGISAFYPSEVSNNIHVPPIVLTDISSENKSIKLDKTLTELDRVNFTYKDYLITFEFAALDYAQPERNQYQYKLEGFDPDWIQNNNLNRATYTNLPSGNYIFKVKGSNNDGVWSEESINLMVTIEPAPWASWWAFLIYAILFCVVLILIIRSQAKRIANQELFQQRVADKVESQTAMFEKDNISLKEQVKNYQHNSGNDLATGLPNQSFFTEQLLVSLAWLKNQQKSEQKLCCIIIKLSGESEIVEKRLAELAEKISENEEEIHLIARWNFNEIALLSFVQTNKQAIELNNRLSGYYISDEDNKNEGASLGYSLVPLHQNDEQSFKWENILMLTEHAMRGASNQQNPKSIGLLASYKKLSPTLIKKVMTSESIIDMKDIFEIDSKS